MRAPAPSPQQLSPRWIVALVCFPLLGFAAALWWVTQCDPAATFEGNGGRAISSPRRTKPRSGEQRKLSRDNNVRRANLVEAPVAPQQLAPPPAIALAGPALAEPPSSREERATTPVTFEDLASRWGEEIETSEDTAWSESIRSFVASVLTSDGGAAPSISVECGKTVCRLELMVSHLGVLRPLEQTMGEDGRDGHTVRVNVVDRDGGVTIEAFMTPGDWPHSAATHRTIAK
jgi:hypothetical protein